MQGNVRELENVVAYGVGMANEDTETLELRHVQARLMAIDGADSDGGELEDRSLTEQVADYEKKLIRAALSKTDGNITRAAVLLDVPRQTLSRKVKEHDL